MKSGVAQLIAELEGLVSLPSVYHEIHAALVDPNCSIQHVAHLILTDPNTTARLMRLANSPLFARGTRVQTLPEAVEHLGTETTRQLVATTAILQYFEGISPDFVDLQSFWKHSISCAIAARGLALLGADTTPDEAFMAGLLHDIGRLVLYLRLPDWSRAMFVECSRTNRPLLELEQRIFDFDHTEVGGELLRLWRFPAPIVEAVEFHHRPKTRTEDSAISAVIHVADSVAHSFGVGTSGELNARPVQSFALARLGLPPGALKQGFSDIGVQLSGIFDILAN